jgi:Flp pilus assembly protein TadG
MRRRRNQKGHAILELALSAGVMVACLGGTFQFGYTFYVYNQLVTAVGNGARYASVRAMTSDEEADKAAIRNMVVYGSAHASGGMAPVVAHLKPEQVEVAYDTETQAVRVAIRNYEVNALFAKYGFDGRPAVEFPYVGGAK